MGCTPNLGHRDARTGAGGCEAPPLKRHHLSTPQVTRAQGTAWHHSLVLSAPGCAGEPTHRAHRPSPPPGGVARRASCIRVCSPAPPCAFLGVPLTDLLSASSFPRALHGGREPQGRRISVKEYAPCQSLKSHLPAPTPGGTWSCLQSNAGGLHEGLWQGLPPDLTIKWSHWVCF